MIPKLYYREEAAKLLKVSPKMIDEYVFTGKLHYTVIGRRRMFTEQHLNEFTKAGEVGS